MMQLEVRNRRFYIKKAIQYIKRKSKCVVCGYNLRTDKLHFHHKLLSVKLFNISLPPKENLSWKVIKDEMNKCIILCMRCHGRAHTRLNKGKI